MVLYTYNKPLLTHSRFRFCSLHLDPPSITPGAYNPRILLADVIAAADPEIDLLSDERGLLLLLPDRLFLIMFLLILFRAHLR